MDSELPFYDWINFLFSFACLRLFVCFFLLLLDNTKFLSYFLLLWKYCRRHEDYKKGGKTRGINNG